MYLTMRGWRHDYHNHMQLSRRIWRWTVLDEARAYLDRLEQDLDDIDLLFHTGKYQCGCSTRSTYTTKRATMGMD